MVTQHISRQQNMQYQNNKNQVEPMALVMKKAYDSNIFVNFIPPSVEEEEFLKSFSVIGKIISLKLSQHPQKSFKHAYVLYETVSEAQKAI